MAPGQLSKKQKTFKWNECAAFKIKFASVPSQLWVQELPKLGLVIERERGYCVGLLLTYPLFQQILCSVPCYVLSKDTVPALRRFMVQHGKLRRPLSRAGHWVGSMLTAGSGPGEAIKGICGQHEAWKAIKGICGQHEAWNGNNSVTFASGTD